MLRQRNCWSRVVRSIEPSVGEFFGVTKGKRQMSFISGQHWRHAREVTVRTFAALLASSLLLTSAADAAPPAGNSSVPPLRGVPAVEGASVATTTGQTDQGHSLERADLEAWLDGLVPYALERGDLAGTVIVVVKNGEVLLKKGYGHADVARGRAMDADRTLMRIGSVSKLFTWTAVMQLVEQGRLDLDKDVSEYLDFRLPAAFDKPVTMRQLMAHRGGFEEGLKAVLITDPSLFISTEQYLKDYPRPRVFSPGEVPAYSNYGTALAGYIVQRISGEPFESYVEQHIFAPLQMTRSTVRQPLPEQFASDMSQGYMKGSGAPLPFELITTAPAGSVTTTAADMAQFMLAYLQQGRVDDGQILSAETVREMQSGKGGFDVPAGFDTMSYGFFDARKNGRRVIGHGGDTILFHSDLNLLPEDGVGIFMSVNSRGAEDAVYALRSGLFDAFMDRYFPVPKHASAATALETAVEDAQRIAGRYESSRRIDTGFLSLFYMLSQTVIVANPDGTIAMPSLGELKTFRETAPDLWSEVGGDQQVALAMIDGRRAVIDSHDPTSILQQVAAQRSAAWNLPALFIAVTILVLTIILWPVNALVRRRYHSPLVLSGRERTAHLLPRIAALIALVYLLCWFAMLTPILSNDLDGYNNTLDPQMRLLQFAGLVLILAAGATVWSAWRTLRGSRGIGAKLGAVLIAFAVLEIVWMGFAFKMISWNLDY
jgi:CubicO group peptidase (beta-lactamase class C family)